MVFLLHAAVGRIVPRVRPCRLQSPPRCPAIVGMMRWALTSSITRSGSSPGLRRAVMADLLESQRDVTTSSAVDK